MSIVLANCSKVRQYFEGTEHGTLMSHLKEIEVYPKEFPNVMRFVFQPCSPQRLETPVFFLLKGKQIEAVLINLRNSSSLSTKAKEALRQVGEQLKLEQERILIAKGASEKLCIEKLSSYTKSPFFRNLFEIPRFHSSFRCTYALNEYHGFWV